MSKICRISPAVPAGRPGARFYSMARGLLAPGPRAYFCPPAKVGKNGLRKLRFLRTFLNYGGNYLRYDLWISSLSSVLWADASAYFCARSYRGTSLPLRGNDRPGSLRLPGCLAALGTGVWQRGCESKECTVRPCAPCRQYPFERPAGGLLQVPERQKKDHQFGGFA